jgi:hypothetical protein
MTGITINTDLTERNFEMVDSESWKAYSIAILLISVPLIMHAVF